MNLIWKDEISDHNLHCTPWKDHESRGNFSSKSIFSHTRDHVTSQRLMTSLTNNNNRLQHTYMAAYNVGGSNNNNNKDDYRYSSLQRGCHGNLQQELFHASGQHQQQMYNYHHHHQQQHRHHQPQIQHHHHHQQQQLQQYYHHHQQQMVTNQIQNATTEAEVTTLQDGDDNDDDDDDTIGHDLAGDDDEEATETATLEERGLNKNDDLPMKVDLKFNFSNATQDSIGTIESKVSIKKENSLSKTSLTDTKLALQDLKSDSDYKHKLILAKKNLSSNSNSPVQSQQGSDLNQPSEVAQQNRSEQLASHHKGPHLNQPIGMGLNIESSNHRHDGSPMPGPSRVDEDCDLRPISDEDRDSTSVERRFRESDEDDDDDDDKSRLPAIFPRMPYDNRKQCLNDHLLQKYMETYKNYPSSSGHFQKQEPLDGGFSAQQSQDYPTHIQPGFGLDHTLPNMFPFLPHPSLAQHQQHRQMLYEYSSRMKSNKEVKPANERRNVFCCHICSFVGSSEEDFNTHMSQHFEHQCPHCTYSSRTEGRLKRHIKDFHSNENDAAYSGQHKSKSSTPKRTCRYCKFYTYDQVEFWMHLKKHIKPEKLLECPHCEFVTELKHHLEYHIRVHIGSKPFKCPKCNYSCVNKSMLNSHMKSHTNVYQFRCRDCNYATKYSHSLKLHLLKKKHHADVVLNSDGSMPTDGSGQFDVVNRRGPPRGPRLVRNRPGPSYSPNSSSSELAQETRRLINQLDDLKARYGGRDMNDTRLSLSPELMGGSRDTSFVPKPQYDLGTNGLATSFSNYARMFSSQHYDCCFCTEKFSTSMLLKDHVEKFHFKTGFGLQAQHKESSYNSNAAFQKCNKTKEAFEILKPKSEPIREGFEDSHPQEVSVTPLDLSNGSKRKMEDADSRNASSPFSEQGSTRKRARKGRAFKLDTRDSHESNWRSEEVADSQIGMAKSSEDSDDNDSKRSRKDEDNSERPNDLPAASSSDDVVKTTTTMKTSPQWKNDDVTEIENSPKSDLSSEGMMHSNEDQKQVPSSSSGSTSHQEKTFSDLKVDSNWHMCRHCEMAFADQMTHRLHMGYHGYYNPFQCNGCGENCVDAFDFMLHLMCKAHK